MSAAFLRDITENLLLASGVSDIAPYVAYAPAGMQHLFDGLTADGTSFVLADGNTAMPLRVTGFGTCLLHAIETLLAAGHDSACVLNSDSPTLPTSFLARTADILAQPGDRAVLGPAEDGGYYLLGVKQAHAALFEDIDWSTQHVAEQTRAQARRVGLALTELPPWYDVDDRASLDRVAREIGRGDGYAAPATARALAALAV